MKTEAEYLKLAKAVEIAGKVKAERQRGEAEPKSTYNAKHRANG